MESILPNRITIEQIGLRFGSMLAGANIGFFLLMAAFGLEDETWLRFVNLVFVFLFVYRGMQHFKHNTQRHWTYLKGLGVGMMIVLIGAALFALFMGIYGLVNQGFVDAVSANVNIRRSMSPLFLAFIIFFETVIYGFILVFAAMQRLKRSHMQDAAHI